MIAPLAVGEEATDPLADGHSMEVPLRLLLLVFALCAACGGRVVEGPVGDDGGSGSDEAGRDGGASPFPICPAEPPDVGAPCSSSHQGCAYTTPGGRCIAYACDGTWRTAPEGC